MKIDELYDESERRGCYGLCPDCEQAAIDDGEELGKVDYHVLCYKCGKCLKYHHERDGCEDGIINCDT